MMAWILFLSGALISWWAGRGLRRGAAGAADAARLSQLTTEITAAGDAVLGRAHDLLGELDEAMVAAEQRLSQLRGALAAPASDAAPGAPAIAASPPSEAPGPPAASPPALPALPESHRLVWQLADSGHDEQTIVRESGLLPGEVRLVLGLRKLRRA